MDAETKKLLRAYRWETDAELERKRKVFLSFVVGQTRTEILEKSMNLEQNKEMYEGLSTIIRGRETRMRVSRELHRWTGVLLPFGLGLLTAYILYGGNTPAP